MSDADVFAFVSNYNWDDGFDAIRPIVNDPATEFATALLIYWRLDGPYLESSSSDVNTEALNLSRLVKERLLAGWYPKKSLQFFPVVHEELGVMQIHKLKKMGVPKELYEPAYPSKPSEQGEDEAR